MSPTTIYPEIQDRTSLSLLLREFLTKFNDLIITQCELALSVTRVTTQTWAATLVLGLIVVFFAALTMVFLGVSMILLLMKPLGLAGAGFVTTGMYLLFAVITALLAKKELSRIQDVTHSD